MRKALCRILTSVTLVTTLLTGVTAYAQTAVKSANLKVETEAYDLQVSDDLFSRISGDLIIVSKDGKYGYADLNKKIVIPYKYKKAWPFVSFMSEIGLVLGQDDKYYTVDISGTEKPLLYNGRQLDIKSDLQPKWLYDNGLISLAPDGVSPKTCYINSDGKTILPLDYYDFLGFSGNNFYILSSKGIYDNSGTMITEWKDGVYIDLGQAIGHASISDELIPFYIKSKDDILKYGYVDLNGNVEIQPIYDSAMPFSNGYAVVQMDGKEFAINTKNEKCTPDFPLYELQYGNMADNFVTHDKILDKNGETLYKCEEGLYFIGINCVYELQNKNVNPVYILQNDDRKRGAVDRYGNQLIPFEYDYINLFINGYSTGVKDGKLYVFKLHSTTVSNPQPSLPDGILYSNNKLGVSVTLPASWKGKYDVEENKGGVSFIHKASKDKNGAGFLFAITRHDEIWTPDIMDRGANSFAMLTDKYTYTFIRPTGVEYENTTEAEYKKLEADIPSVKKTLQRIAIKNAAATYNAVGKTDENGLTDNYIYSFANGSIDAAPGDCLLMVNGSFSATKVIAWNNSTLVPVRIISEAFGANVLWDGTNNTVTIHNSNGNNNEIQLKIGEKTATVNGKAVALDVAPVIDNGSTYVPIRFVSESLNKAVGYLPVVNNNNTDIILAKNPVVWIDDSTQIDEKTINTALAGLKSQFNEGLAYMKNNYSTDIHYKNIDVKTMEATFAEIENDIQKTQYIGQVGRYLVFQGPYLTLLDLNSGEVFFYGSGNAFCGIHKANMKDVEAFGAGYFFG